MPVRDGCGVAEIGLSPEGLPQAKPPSGIDFDVELLTDCLAKRMPGMRRDLADGGLRLRKISGGQSNPTFVLSVGASEFILRKAPTGANLPAAHAVDREYRVMSAIADRGVPVPRMVFMEESREVLGAPFYLMERLDGVVEHDSRLPEFDAAYRTAIYDEQSRTLARLHRIDWKAAGLDDFGRHGGFFTRQINRWTKQWALSKTREIPEIDQLAVWLAENNREDDETSIVHGDYRLGNLMIDRHRPRIVGVLDWELSTLGHPLADLAHTTAMWFVRPEEYGGLFGCDLGGLGIPERGAFVAAYLEESGRSDAPTAFHYAFALFRFAVIFEGIAARARDGTAASDNAHAVGQLSSTLARRAADIAGGDLSIGS